MSGDLLKDSTIRLAMTVSRRARRGAPFQAELTLPPGPYNPFQVNAATEA